MTPELLTIAFAVFLLAGTLKGMVGMGLPVTSVGLLSLFADPRVGVTAAILPIFVSNIWQIYRAGDTRAAIGRYWPFAAALFVVMLPATALSPLLPTNLLIFIVGVAIVLFSVTSLVAPPFTLPERYDRAWQIAGGMLSGLLGGLTAIWSPPMVIYFLGRGLGKDEFIRASGLLFFTGGVPLLIGYVANGLLNAETASLSAMMIVPTLIGFAVGERIRAYLHDQRFRTAVLIIFLLMGLNLLREALF